MQETYKKNKKTIDMVSVGWEVPLRRKIDDIDLSNIIFKVRPQDRSHPNDVNTWQGDRLSDVGRGSLWRAAA